jgi:hypothetical protein
MYHYINDNLKKHLCTQSLNQHSNQTAETEVDWTYIEEGFLCHRKAILG